MWISGLVMTVTVCELEAMAIVMPLIYRNEKVVIFQFVM